jgi:hypothetical protein
MRLSFDDVAIRERGGRIVRRKELVKTVGGLK